MTPDQTLALARAIHGTPHATRTSFSPEQWKGVERAWEWIGKNYVPQVNLGCECVHCMISRKNHEVLDANYHPQEPPMKQETCTTCGATDPNAQGFCSNAFHAPPPTWTAEQREAACDVRAACWLKEDDEFPEICAAIAKVAPLFVSHPPVPSVEECERAYSDGFATTINTNGGNDAARSRRAGIAAVRALFVQGDTDERIAELTKDRDEAISKGLAVDTANTDRDLTYLTVQRLTDRVVDLREECRRYKESVKEMKRRVALAEANERGKARSVTREELSGAMADVFGSYHRRTIERTDMENAILRHLCS